MAVDQEPRKWIDDESTRRIVGLFFEVGPTILYFCLCPSGLQGTKSVNN